VAGSQRTRVPIGCVVPLPHAHPEFGFWFLVVDQYDVGLKTQPPAPGVRVRLVVRNFGSTEWKFHSKRVMHALVALSFAQFSAMRAIPSSLSRGIRLTLPRCALLPAPQKICFENKINR
jgi:hypothetical protein